VFRLAFQLDSWCAWCYISALVAGALGILWPSASFNHENLCSPKFFGVMLPGLTIAAIIMTSWNRFGDSVDPEYDKIALSKLANEELVPHDSIMIGRESAVINLVMFVDLRCGTCLQTLPDAFRFVNSNPKARVILRHFVPKLDSDSIGLAMILEGVARQDRLEAFLHHIKGDPPLELGGYQEAAEFAIGQPVSFDSEARTVIERDFHLSSSLGLRGTPFAVLIEVDGKRTVLSTFELRALINGRL
jgi:hypothetical protein